MDNSKAKKYKIWYQIFLGIGLFGLFDVVVGVLMRQSGVGFEDGGGLTFMIVYAFLYLFGTKVATSILPFVMWISFTWFIWLGISVVLHRKIINLEKSEGSTNRISEKKPMSKGFKITLLVLLIPFGILLLIGIIANLVSN